jgi:hypothetical protein
VLRDSVSWAKQTGEVKTRMHVYRHPTLQWMSGPLLKQTMKTQPAFVVSERHLGDPEAEVTHAIGVQFVTTWMLFFWKAVGEDIVG